MICHTDQFVCVVASEQDRQITGFAQRLASKQAVLRIVKCPMAYAKGSRLCISRRNTATFVGQFADQPIGLDRIVEPGGRPAMINAALDCLVADLFAIFVKQWQFSARLAQAPT